MSLRKILGDMPLGPVKGIAAAFAFGLAIFAMQPIASAADPLGVDDGTQLTLWTRAATQARVDQLVQAYNAGAQEPDHGHLCRDRRLPDQGRARLPLRTACRICSRQTSCSCRTGRRPASSRTSPTASTTCPVSSNVAQAGDRRRRPGTARSTACPSSPTSRCGCGTRSFQAGRPRSRKRPDLARGVCGTTRVPSRSSGTASHGTFCGGSCGGCEVFTWMPIAWADGETVMNPEGTESHCNSDEWKAIFKIFHDMAADGTALMPDTQTETGPTWTSLLPQGHHRRHADAGHRRSLASSAMDLRTPISA